ncbi:hypothetical protein ACJRO7_005745 [Eucalyptus globulus]|uniref:Uncharacterized protein n=1 Tax=Eucalyptus globulus TaxID=34317 RepID=A0ABD3J3M6_EUCGL
MPRLQAPVQGEQNQLNAQDDAQDDQTGDHVILERAVMLAPEEGSQTHHSFLRASSSGLRPTDVEILVVVIRRRACILALDPRQLFRSLPSQVWYRSTYAGEKGWIGKPED